MKDLLENERETREAQGKRRLKEKGGSRAVEMPRRRKERSKKWKEKKRREKYRINGRTCVGKTRFTYTKDILTVHMACDRQDINSQ